MNDYLRLTPVAQAVAILARELQIEARVRAASQAALKKPG